MYKVYQNKIITIALGAIFLCSASQAFAGPGHNRGKKRNPAQRLAKKLNLDSTQEETVRGFFRDARDTCESIDSRKAHRQCMKEQRTYVNEKINSILNDDQKNQFAQMQERRAQKRAEREGNRRLGR